LISELYLALLGTSRCWPDKIIAPQKKNYVYVIREVMNEPLKEHMYIIKASCYKCKTSLNIAIIDRDLNNSSMRGPESFSSGEIKIAQNNDDVIKERHSCELKVGLIILLAENGYPPVDRDEVYKEIFEQAENFKKYHKR
jgi:hypothetical protein